MIRRCPRCDKVFPIDNFVWNKKAKVRHLYCKRCIEEQERERQRFPIPQRRYELAPPEQLPSGVLHLLYNVVVQSCIDIKHDRDMIGVEDDEVDSALHFLSNLQSFCSGMNEDH